MRYLLIVGYFIFVVLLGSGCSKLNLNYQLFYAQSIRGKVNTQLIQDSSSTSSFLSIFSQCSTPKVFLRELQSGANEPAILDEAFVESDGKYSLNNIGSLKVKKEAVSSQINYYVELSCGSTTMSRFVTGVNDQDISFGTSLLSFATSLSDVKGSSAQSWEGLYQQLESSQSFLEAYNTLISNADSVSQIEILTGELPPAFQNAAPLFREVVLPSILSEKTNLVFNAAAYHWRNSYDVVYEWYVDSQFVQVGAIFNYSFSANSQGSHDLKVVVGVNNGSGRIDNQHPINSRSYVLNVENSVLPVSPAVSRVSAEHTNSTTLQIQLVTGASQGDTYSHCESFSSLAIVEESPVPLSIPPQATAFSYSCHQANTQNIALAALGVEGSRVLRVWARDNSGTVSLVPQEVVFNYDVTSPSVHVTTPASGSVLTATPTFTGTCESPHDVKITGDMSVALLTVACVSGTFSANVTFSAGDGLKAIAVAQEDLAGNSGQDTILFTQDATPPVPPALTLASSTISSSLSAEIHTVCDMDWSSVLYSESSTAPLATDSSWESCIGVKTWTLSSGDGSKLIYAYSKDMAGNVSAASAPVTVILDQTPPSLALTSLNSGAFKGGSLQDISWILSDVHLPVNCLSIDYSPDDGVSWISITSGVTNTSPYSWTLPSIDNDDVRVRLSCIDSAGNTSSVISSSRVTIDSTLPVMSSVLINNGASNTSIVFVNVAVEATDNLSAQLQYRLSLANPADQTCQSVYVDNNWSGTYNVGTLATIPFALNSSDGIKKVCVWAKDLAGNVSVISPDLGNDTVDFDEIDFFIGNPPQIMTFSVVNNNDLSKTFGTGSTARISWSITDAEGLDNNPVILEYTKNGSTWIPIVTNYGGLGGNPTTYDHVYTDWTIPADIDINYFRVRIRAVDTAQNTSTAVISDVLNGEADPIRKWAVFAGSRDIGVGGNQRGLSLESGTNINSFAISPINGDIYALTIVSGSVQIVKIDAATGETSTFIKAGTTNLPNIINTLVDIPLDAAMGFSPNSQLLFDKMGKLYVREGVGNTWSARLWQFDFQNNKVRLYAGADNGVRGTVDNSTASSGTVFLATDGNMDFDNENSLYFTTYCGGTYVSTSTTARRILKLTQMPDGSAGTISEVAGDCTIGEPANGLAALSTPLLPQTSMGEISIAAISPVAIYYRRSGRVYKVINGVSYSTTISASQGYGIHFNSVHNKLYVSSNGTALSGCLIDLLGSGGEVCEDVVKGILPITPGCTDDGVAPLDACVFSRKSILSARDGTLIFADGLTSYRIRYIDSNNTIRTLVGSKPFYGDGLEKNLSRGLFHSIYYKKASEPNQGAFPEGLYFLAKTGPVFGRIETNGIINVLAGNQIAFDYTILNGTPMVKDMPVGSQDTLPLGLTFDEQGLPWMSFSRRLYSIDVSRNFVTRMSYANGGNWTGLAPGTNIANYSLDAFAGYQNFQLKNDKFFVFGTYHDATTGNNYPNPVLRIFDFSSTPVVTHVMGGTGVVASADVITPSDLSNLSFDGYCIRTNCSLRFIENGVGDSDDQLFIAEYRTLRFITNPLTPGSGLITTVFTHPTKAIYNFIHTEDKKRIFFFLDDGLLYCHAISSIDARTWCPQSNWVSLGPITGMDRVAKVTNQMTWKNSTTLLISNGYGEVLQYTVPVSEL